MPDGERVLRPSAAQAYYDRFGRKQDSQGFYEDPALDDLIAHASLRDAQSVFEFGCGTGKLAARLLAQRLSSAASYRGCDISPVMVGLARRRLEAYGERAQVTLSDGTVRFPCRDQSVDRVISTYVLDLLSEADIGRFFAEARRVVMPGGLVCLASLTGGVSLPSRIVSSLWMAVFRVSPALVGGCRPIHLDSFVDRHGWGVAHQRVVTPFAVPSEVLVLAAVATANNGPRRTRLRAAA